MNADAYSSFVNMFQALDALWGECHDGTLGGFLSEASPFTFAGKGSADPAIYLEFSRAFAQSFPGGSCSIQQAHGFALGYLAGISEEYSKAYPGKKRLDAAFLEIAPLERWEAAFEPYLPPEQTPGA